MTLKTNHQETLCQVNLVFRGRLHLTPCRKARVSVRITEENLGAHPLYNNVSSPFIERRDGALNSGCQNTCAAWSGILGVPD